MRVVVPAPAGRRARARIKEKEPRQAGKRLLRPSLYSGGGSTATGHVVRSRVVSFNPTPSVASRSGSSSLEPPLVSLRGLGLPASRYGYLGTTGNSDRLVDVGSSSDTAVPRSDL